VLFSKTEYNPALWKRNLFILSISQFLYRAGTRSIVPFLPLFIKDLGKTGSVDTAVWSGWIFAVPFIVSFFTTPFWGGVGDKYGRKFITLLAIFGFAISQLLMGISSSLTWLLIFASLQEAMGGFYPSSVSLIASNAPKEDTARALGYFQFSSASGSIIGPILGGVIADFFGFRQVFFLVAGTAVFCGIIISLFVMEENVKTEKKKYFSLTENWKHVFEKRMLLICMLFLLFHSLGVTIIRPTFTLFIGSFNYAGIKTSTLVGLLLGVSGFASALSSALAGKMTKDKNPVLILIPAAIVNAVTLIVIPFAGSITLISTMLIINGLAMGLMLPLGFTLISSNTESDRKAGIIGVGSSLQIIGNLAGSITAGYIVSSFGIGIPFIISGSLFLIIVLLFAIKPLLKEF
jgi:MFS transporter, DHA1 family, multidrug resistance protein